MDVVKELQVYGVEQDCCLFFDAAEEIESLRVKLGEAEKDAKRIDYLSEKCCGASDSERYLPFRLYWGKGTHKTIREVIDAAMEEHKDEI